MFRIPAYDPVAIAVTGFGIALAAVCDFRPLKRSVPVLNSAGAPVYLHRMPLLSERRRIQDAIPFLPCLPRWANTPTGLGWVHEIKHDGFRILARREGDRVRLCQIASRKNSRRFAARSAD